MTKPSASIDETNLRKLKAALAEDPGATKRALSHAIGISMRQIRKLYPLACGAGAAPVNGAHLATPRGGATAGVLTLSDIRRRFDVAEKIRLGIREHLAGKDAFIDEARFRELCGVHVNQWRRFATLPEFAEHQIMLQRVPHWAAPANIKKAREVLGA